MKYYKEKSNIRRAIGLYWHVKGLHCVHYNYNNSIHFYNCRALHNLKGAALFEENRVDFYIQNKFIGTKITFKSNKEWRKYLKLLIFL